MASSSSSSSLKSLAMALAFFFFFFVGSSSASVYTVGGTKGWTAKSPPNYTALAAMETFHVGDTLMFVYHVEYHNVVKVQKSDYDNCTVSAAIKTYQTGNDSVTITAAGTHYFFCSVQDHCIRGQKIEVSATTGNGSSAAPAAPNAAALGRNGVVIGLVLAALLSAY